jgi:hypothetical protein
MGFTGVIVFLKWIYLRLIWKWTFPDWRSRQSAASKKHEKPTVKLWAEN